MEPSKATEGFDANETEIATAAVGRRVRTARRERGLTLEDLGGGTLSRSFLSRVENGKTRISLKSLHKIATRLQLPMSHFLEGAVESGEVPLEITLDEAESLLARSDPEAALAKLNRISAAGSLEARLLYLRGRILVALNRNREAMEVLQAGREVASQREDSHALAQIECVLGTALYGLGVYDEALVHFRAAINGGQGAVEDPAVFGTALAGTGNVFYVRGDMDAAADYYSRARAYMKAVNDLDTAGQVGAALSTAYREKGDISSAVRYSTLSAGSFRLKQNAFDAGRELAAISLRYLGAGDLENAAETARDAVSLAVAIHHAENEALARSALATILLQQGNAELAAQEANCALSLDPKGATARSNSKLVLARICSDADDLEAADQYFKDVVGSLRGTDDQIGFAEAAIEYSRFLHKRGDVEAAFSLMLEATEKHRPSLG
jgi:tetratricopeptide (TPR) repeat protein